ncbi:hypothetical protein MBLNU459_g0100t1 [Dothideomycetes sp. NU459]
MSTKLAAFGPGPMNGMHTAGIFSDMTVDGPEIGTLVVIVDRAKNLPNRKTMGKQNPYCAARLGKDAKKTETDKRGGQTPKWDQELRFTVHESPDYRNLKVSVFNDDKKTDLIGETWVSLDNVVIDGGGRNDTWHSLNYKGKYAGEIMLELTYYDSRPKVESKRRESVAGDERKQQHTPIKRRPLPTDPSAVTPSPTVTPDVARAAGPRTMGPRSREGSAPVDSSSPYGRSAPAYAPSSSSAPPPAQHTHHAQYQYQQPDDFEYHPGFQPPPSVQPDFLPELPPSNRARGGLRPQTATAVPAQANSYHGKALVHPELPHSHSAPSGVPTEHQYHDPYASRSPVPAPRQRRYDEPPGWEGSQVGGYSRSAMQPTVEDEIDRVPSLPPLPPSHRNSAPAVPRQSQGQTHGHGQYVPSVSPLQSVERHYPSPRAPPSRGRTVDDYSDAPVPYANDQPNFRKSYSGPPQHQQGYAPSPPQQQQRPPPNHRLPARHSIAEPYHDSTTPPRAHPLAQEMRRSASPAPYYAADPAFDEPQHQAYYNRDVAPMIKPRPVSPQPPSRNSLASIQHPVSTFAANHASTPDLRNSRLPNRSTPTRKSVSPQPSSVEVRSSVPFSPDSFDSYNPNSQRSSFAANANPHSPYHIPAGPKNAPPEEAPRPLPNPDDPIVGWDGRTIDPSDHLPVHSWAPEPEKKTPTKTYGAGSDPVGPRGLSGPRTTPASISGGRRDMIVNVRTKGHPHSDPPTPNSAVGRNRLVKRNGPHSPNPQADSAGFPLNEIDVPNPYAGGNNYSSKFADSRPGVGSEYGMQSRYQNPSPGSSRGRDQDRHYGDLFGGGYENQSQYGGYENDGFGGGSYAGGVPDVPPKIPIGYDQHGYGESALSREMASINIGGSRPRERTPGAGTVRRTRFG